jgi:mRNA interferase YafQ
MKYSLQSTTKFRKDVKRAEKRGLNALLLNEIIKKLANGEQLEEKYQDHSLSGNYANCRECHIAPDWLLIYELYEETLILYLMRTGTHSDLFDR